MQEKGLIQFETVSLSQYQKEAFMYGYNLQLGYDNIDINHNVEHINNYHNYAPIRLINGDVVTSNGELIPKRCIESILWFEKGGILKDYYDSVLAFEGNLKNPFLDESMTSFNIKPSKLDEIQLYGYLKNLEKLSHFDKVHYLNNNSYQAVGEMLCAYRDRWTPESIGKEEKVKQQEFDRNFALYAQLYHQSEQYPPNDKPQLESWGYGIIAHNHMWYTYNKKTPEYSGKFTLIDGSFEEVKGKNPTEKDKSEYSWRTRVGF